MAHSSCDILTAFKNGGIHGELYGSYDDVAYKFEKNVDTLNQSSPLRKEKLKKNRESFDFKQNASSECVFKIRIKKFQVVISLYVDDLIATGSNSDRGSRLKDGMRSSFKLFKIG